jgi:hypothetical protein
MAGLVIPDRRKHNKGGRFMKPRSLILGIAACLLAAAWAGPAAAATASNWQVLPTVNQEAGQVTDSQFLGVSLASPTDGWAVGAFDDENAVGHPLVEHWDGTTWALGKAPQPAGRSAQLAGVDELSPSDVWAVGDSEGDGGVTSDLPLIEHWTGSSWSMVTGVSLPAGASGVLNAIGGSGPDDLWAVGYQLSADESQESLLIEHYDGTKWENLPFPAQENACDSGLSDCFLDATAVAASAPDNAWLAGNVAQPNDTQHVLAHWNGTSWKLATAPCLEGTATATCDPEGTDLNRLTGLTVLSPTDAWASGSEGNVNDENFNIPYVLHFNGTSWSLTKTPNRGGEGSLLNAISAVSASDIWAVGQVQQLNGAIQTLTEQFNGTAWAVVASPSPGSSPTDDGLDGVASAGSGQVFAAGAREVAGQCCLRTLALRNTSG